MSIKMADEYPSAKVKLESVTKLVAGSKILRAIVKLLKNVAP